MTMMIIIIIATTSTIFDDGMKLVRTSSFSKLFVAFWGLFFFFVVV